MTSLSDVGAPGGWLLDEEFVGLLYADDDLVRAEFDAIVAAEWPAGPPPRSESGAPRRPERPAAGSPAVLVAEFVRPGDAQPRAVAWGRPRSPPRLTP